MRIIFTYLLVLFCVANTPLTAQEKPDYSVQKLKLANESTPILLTNISEKDGTVITAASKDYVSSWSTNLLAQPGSFTLTGEGAEFNKHEFSFLKLLESSNYYIETASPAEETTVFSANFQGKSSVYIKQSESHARVLFSASGITEYLHPFITPDGTQIFFSSNFENSANNFDLFVVNKLDSLWSSPVRLNSTINDLNNQVFPTWYDDTLFYSSSSSGNLDIYSSAKLDQYKSIQKLKEPFNSADDDFLLHKRNAENYYINSNRQANTDHPYLITRKKAAISEKMLITGYLACSGNRISNIPVTLSTILGSKIDTDVTDGDGGFILRADKKLKKYKLKLEKEDAKLLDCAILYITDEKGNVIQKIKVNKRGEFTFEMIDPDEISNLLTLAIEDESLLQIEVNGQIYEETPGDVGTGEPVKILTETGDIIALAYTSEEGKFKFSDLSPESKYNIEFDENSKQLQLNIIKDGEVIPVDVENNGAVYTRISEEESIDLIDDRGKHITIQKDEFFNLQNIFYATNSSELSEIAKFQLDRFAQFIFNNDEISIDLISHTDSKGTATYNLELSEKRSNQAKSYLISKGVQPERLKAYGMGEKELLNQCVDGVSCSDEEHAVNRRTEIRIIVLE